MPKDDTRPLQLIVTEAGGYCDPVTGFCAPADGPTPAEADSPNAASADPAGTAEANSPNAAITQPANAAEPDSPNEATA